MYICICKAVSERRIGDTVAREGVTSFRELRQRLGVGTVCGRCAPAARDCLHARLADSCPAATSGRDPDPLVAATG